MKKMLIAFVAVLFISCTVFAQEQEMKGNGSYILDENGNLIETKAPIINFEVESYDFGKRTQTEKGKVEDRISYEFKFTNDGQEPLIISNAKGSCGCTVPKWPKEPVMPGETSSIKVTYDSSRLGPFTKSITITSNAYTPTKRLMIRGNMLKPGEEPVKELTTPVKTPSIVNEGADSK